MRPSPVTKVPPTTTGTCVRGLAAVHNCFSVSGTVRALVYDDRVAELYLGPTLTARLRSRLSPAA